jgi:hypothetical protein
VALALLVLLVPLPSLQVQAWQRVHLSLQALLHHSQLTLPLFRLVHHLLWLALALALALLVVDCLRPPHPQSLKPHLSL